MEDNNYYEDKQNRKFLDNTTEKNKNAGKTRLEKTLEEETQKEKLNRTVKDVGTDVVAGILGGGLGAAVLGSYSFFAGLLVSGFGHYTKNKYIARLGFGIMASSSMKATQGVKQNPNAGMLNNIQERVKAFGQELQRKLLLDKLLAGKKQNDSKALDNLNGITLQKEEAKTPPTELFENKDRIEQNIVVLKKVVTDHTVPEENKWTERPVNKTFYKDDNDDLTDITDRLY